jgi:hypothetical protein
MRPTNWRALALAMLTLVFCQTLPACGLFGPVDWPKVAQCGGEIASDLLGVVSRILLVGAAVDDQLQQLAEEHGAKTIACVVDEVVNTYRRPGASMTPETEAAAARGEAFLLDHGVGEVRP